jgi:hypothetical protein
MGVEYNYFCDFCKKETSIFSELKSGEIICKECLEHLKNQTWKYSEDQTEREKIQKELKTKEKELTAREEEINNFKRIDHKLLNKYRHAFYYTIDCYNRLATELYEISNGYFYKRKHPFEKIDIDKLAKLEGTVIDEVVMDELDNNMKRYFYDALQPNAYHSLEDLPTIPYLDPNKRKYAE